MSRLEKQLMSILNQDLDYSFLLKKFIYKKINNKIFGNKNKKELLKLFPVLFSYTDYNNRYWLDLISLFKELPDFIDVYITNFSKIKFDDKLYLFEIVLSKIKNLDLTREQMVLFIDEVLKCNIELSVSTYNFVYSIIISKYPELKQVLLEKYVKNKNSCNAVIFGFRYDKNGIEILYNNIDFILENIRNNDLFTLIDVVKDNEVVTKKVKEYVDNNKKESVGRLINNLQKQYCDIGSLKMEEKEKLQTVTEVIYLILEDVCKNEFINISDIKFLSYGAYSSVLEVGEKVVKIGKKRASDSFPNNPYINATLLRKEFSVNDHNSLIVEVNEKLDIKSEITDEELYKLYKKIRDIGLVWTDIAKRNVGRLKKDNIIHWREFLPITDEVLGLEKYRGTEILKKGEIVVLDNDFIFDENEKVTKTNNNYQRRFETRYQKEKNNKLNEEYSNKEKGDIEVSNKQSRSR